MINTKKVKKISILSTQQNYKWVSMREVLPSIEKCWVMACNDQLFDHKLINADTEPLRNYIHFLMECDLIVVIAFNETISKLMRQIRLNFYISAPFVLHLYGHGTLGLWPQYRFGVLEIMTNQDIFIGTCPGDIACVKLTSSNAHVLDIPYPHFPLEQTVSITAIPTKVFAYIGRITDQKNLDILIEAYHLLHSQNSGVLPLYIYGKEDYFGSPNMGIVSTECLQNLKELVKEYGLTEKIIFKGFIERELLYQELSESHIFVSPSTHSDENFGMALMRSLALGASAVVSDWGGHKVFSRLMPERVLTSKVIFEKGRPLISALDFSLKMKEASEKKSGSISRELALPTYFSAEAVSYDFQNILKKLDTRDSANVAEKLTVTETTRVLYKQQAHYESTGDIQRAFNSYEDPIAQLYLKAYSED
jgi:glycosyltransferase involved in cell wall biosynthesis